MKNDKTNKKPRKVKNYLSSLCKWAKNNILNIFCALMSAILLLGIFSSSCNNSKTTAQAQAQSTISDTPILFLPSVKYSYGGNEYYSTPLFLFGTSNSANGAVKLFYQNSGSKVSYLTTPFDSRVAINDSNVVYGCTTSARPHFFSSEITSSYSYFNLGSYPNDRYLLVDKISPTLPTSIWGMAFVEFLFNNCTGFSVHVGNSNSVYGYPFDTESGYIEYRFWATDDLGEDYSCASLIIGGLFVTDTPYVTATTQNIIWLSQLSSDIDGYVETLINQSYNNGYDEGYYIGFDEGYDIGLEEGYQLETPLDFLSSGIDSLFRIQVFGDIALGDILRIGFACVLLGFLIKIFLGG